MASTESGTPPDADTGSNRGRIVGAVLILVFLIVLLSFRGLLTLYTDFLWFDDLGQTSVWTGILGAQIVLSIVFVATFFVLAWVNLVIADRIAPPLRPPGPEEELLVRWHETIGRRNGLVRFVVAGFFALVAGGGAASQWREWVLFTNPVDFETADGLGVTDPVFGENVGFYVFRLPFLSFVVSWFFAAFVIIGIITGVWHYVNGGIRIQTVDPNRRSTPQVKAHISVILAILAALKAADYWLQRYELLGSTQGFRRGAFYTDINASLPAIQLLFLISLFSIGLLVWNIRRRGWTLPAVAVGLWALIAIIAGGIYPAAIQYFQVRPAELSRERLYIERNIAATREAIGLADVEDISFEYTNDPLTTQELLDAQGVLSTVRLLDPRIVADSFTRNQVDLDTVYDDFSDGVDVDRYVIDDELTPVVVGVRELNNDIEDSWEVRHAVNTHGYGLVMAPANRFNDQGKPEFVIRDAPLRNDLDEITLDQPQVYFGDDIEGYAVVGTTQAEFDYVEGFAYQGDGGVPMTSFFRRLAFAFRFGALEPLISGVLTDDTEVIFARDVTDRARRVAPFLHYDANPYPVVFDGGISYVIDAYTTSDQYPYAQDAAVASLRQLPADADLRHEFNYIRNSVKVVVDAYDGTVDFFVVDEADPVLQSYRQAFPELFRDLDQMPDEIRSHLRVPEDLFRIQTETWGRYQLTEAAEFHSGNLEWAIAGNSDEVSGGVPTVQFDLTDPTRQETSARPVDPYYQVTQLPNEDELTFIISRPFVRTGRPELSAYMIGRILDDGTTELRQYTMTDTSVRGPIQVAELLDVDPTISEEATELGTNGSQFLPGNLMVLLVDDTVVYVRPFYVRREPTAESPEATEPLIEFVAVVQDERIGFADTYAGALAQLFGITGDQAIALVGGDVSGAMIDSGPTGSIDLGEVPEGVAQELAQILDRFTQAEAALPDFAEYERLQQEALDDLQALLDAVEAEEVDPLDDAA